MELRRALEVDGKEAMYAASLYRTGTGLTLMLFGNAGGRRRKAFDATMPVFPRVQSRSRLVLGRAEAIRYTLLPI